MTGLPVRRPSYDALVVRKPQVAANEAHEVVKFPGLNRAVQVKKDSPTDAIMRGFQQAGFKAQQTGASHASIAQTFAALDAAIRNPDYQTVLEGGKSIADVASDVHTRTYSILSYIAQDLVNNKKADEAAPLQALLAKAKKDREAPNFVSEQQQQRPDPYRQEKDRQAQQQQPQM